MSGETSNRQQTQTYHGCLTRAFRRVRSCTAADSSAHGVRGAHIQIKASARRHGVRRGRVCATGDREGGHKQFTVVKRDKASGRWDS